MPVIGYNNGQETAALRKYYGEIGAWIFLYVLFLYDGEPPPLSTPL